MKTRREVLKGAAAVGVAAVSCVPAVLAGTPLHPTAYYPYDACEIIKLVDDEGLYHGYMRVRYRIEYYRDFLETKKYLEVNAWEINGGNHEFFMKEFAKPLLDRNRSITILRYPSGFMSRAGADLVPLYGEKQHKAEPYDSVEEFLYNSVQKTHTV